MADGGLEKKQAEFEDVQLKGLDIQLELGPDDVLKKARAINLITDKVLKDIEDSGVKDKLATSFTVAREKAEAAERAEMEDDKNLTNVEKQKFARTRAFRVAFRLVYGRFLMDVQDDALDSIDESAADLLKVALKFPIEDKDKLKGRSELKAALIRLEKASRSDPTGIKIKIQAKVAEAKAKFTEAKSKNQVAVDRVKSFEINAVNVTLKEAKDLYSLPFNTQGNQDYAKSTANVLSKIDLIANNTNLPPGIKKFCSKYLANYKPGTTEKEIEDFYIDNLGSFLDELDKKITKYFAPLFEFAKEEQKKTAEKLATAKNELEAAKSVTFESWIMNAAFPKTKSGAEIKGLERVHEEATGKQKDVRTTYEYFAHHHNMEIFLDAHNSYEKIVGGTTKLGAGDGFYAKRAEAKRNFEVTDKALKDLYEPTETSLSRTLAELLKSHKASGSESKFDAETKRKELIDDYDLKKGKYTTNIVVYEEDKDVYDNIFEHASKLHAETKKLVQNLEAAQKLGIPFEDGFDARATVEKFKKYEPKSRSFNPIDFLAYSEELRGYFGNHHKVEHLQQAFDAKLAESEKKVKDAKKALDKESAKAEKEKNLTDDQAAKRIIGAIVYEQFPDMSPMDHNKLVSMILADDVATLQTDEGYEALAQRASAEDFKMVESAFRAKLINFRFKEADKITQPFKGLKPDDFKDWASIEKLFLYGKLNYKNGFFLLVALEHFDNGVKSIQAVRLEKKLKALLAKQLGVDKHMDKAGISKVVDDAFKDQMEKVGPIMKAHFDLTESPKFKEAKGHKKKVLDMKYEDLNDQLRTEKIGQHLYEQKLKALVKEASDADVAVEFSADSVGAQLWNSPEAQWLKDKAHDASAFVGKKALAAGFVAPGKIMMKGTWGASKLVASLGFQGAMLPVRAAKYPLLLAAKPMVGAINLFRANKWTPLPGIRDSIKNDASRVIGYTSEKASGAVKGAVETVTKTMGEEWNKVQYADVKYADRQKHEMDERAELLKTHEPKAELDAVELGDSPFVDLAKYKKQIEIVTKALGITIDATSGHEVKVGHEEPAKAEKHEKPEEKEEPKKAAGGHH